MRASKFIGLLTLVSIYPSIGAADEIVMGCTVKENRHISEFTAIWRYKENWNTAKIDLRHQGNWQDGWCGEEKLDCSIGDRGGYRIYQSGDEIVEETIDFIVFQWSTTIWSGDIDTGKKVGGYSATCYPVKS